jgi:hypothetical protein
VYKYHIFFFFFPEVGKILFVENLVGEKTRESHIFLIHSSVEGPAPLNSFTVGTNLQHELLVTLLNHFQTIAEMVKIQVASFFPSFHLSDFPNF